MKQPYLSRAVQYILPSLKDIEVKIIRSSSYDPWYNLAWEEALLNQVSPNQVLLFLWQNERTVVLGRNQNAWRECRHRLLKEEGGKLARRLSGGGAVYHDLGNLNYTFLLNEEQYQAEICYQIILAALRKLAIEAEFSGRNDLLVQGKKFSGNATYKAADRIIHHGTILVDTQLSKLVRYLEVARAKIVSKGIDSVESRVVNLCSFRPGIDVESVKECLEESFLNYYQSSRQSVYDYSNPPETTVETLYEKYASWGWRFGETPEFDVLYSNRFDWGGIELGFKVEKGTIQSITIYSDAMEADIIPRISQLLIGSSYRKDVILRGLALLRKESEFISNDLMNWLGAVL